MKTFISYPIRWFTALDPGGKLLNLWLMFVALMLPLSAKPIGMAMILVSFLLVMPAILFFGEQYWFIRLVAGVFPRKYTPVMLVDYQGQQIPSLARKRQDGTMHASVYFMTNTGDCILESNGTVSRKSNAVYIYFWIPIRKSELMMHYLTCDVPDFDYINSLRPHERGNILHDMLYKDQ